MDYHNYFEKARKIAFKSKYQIRVGACIVQAKSTYLGFNKADKTDPNCLNEYNNIHAELDAIKKAGIRRDFSGASIFVYRLMRNGTAGLAKPCSSCRKLLHKYGIHQIYYSIDSFSFGTLTKKTIEGHLNETDRHNWLYRRED